MEILEVFGYRCAYCLRANAKLEMDHVVSAKRGGAFSAENIVPACRGCNAHKSDRPVFMMAAA